MELEEERPLTDHDTACAPESFGEESERYLIGDSFAEVPVAWWCPSRWHIVMTGRWKDDREPINIEEGRPDVLAL